MPKDRDDNNYFQSALVSRDPEPGEGLAQQENLAMLDRLLNNLLPQERAVILARSRGAKFRQIAAEYRVTKQRIQQIERTAFKKMKELAADLDRTTAA